MERSANSRVAVVIDLTSEDDEEEEIRNSGQAGLISSYTPLNSHRIVQHANFPPSHHGLPLIGEWPPAPNLNQPTTVYSPVSADRRILPHLLSTREYIAESQDASDTPNKRRKISGHMRPVAHGQDQQYKPQIVPTSRIPAILVPQLVSEGTTVITGGNRAEASRSDEEGEAYKRIHSQQVIPHIVTAFRRHLSTVPYDKRTEIAVKVAKELIEDPEFVDHVESNGYKLLPEYEARIAIRAGGKIDQYSYEYLQNIQSGSNQILSTGDPSGIAIERDDIHSETSSFREEIFDRQDGNFPSVSKSSRVSSDSPSTPFSNDLDHEHAQIPSLLVSAESQNPEIPVPSRRSRRAVKVQTRPPRNSRSKPSNTSASPDPSESNEVANVVLSTRDLKPYLRHQDRERLRLQTGSDFVLDHVDFSFQELESVCTALMKYFGVSGRDESEPSRQIVTLMAYKESLIPSAVRYIQRSLRHELPRLAYAIAAFLEDAVAGHIAIRREPVASTRIRQKKAVSRSPYSLLLAQREVSGMASSRVRSGRDSFKRVATNHLEDCLSRRSEWVDCAGDISTITWTSSTSFICGATAHSDPLNMQYNKPGNLLVGSSSMDTLKAMPHHRIARPIVSQIEGHENSLLSMRRTQSPWIYQSVVSTAHCKGNGYIFTASFDKTVKVWSMSTDQTSLEHRGTWEHDGNVNFVVTSENHTRIATACGSSSNVVRIYEFDDESISESPYNEYHGDKASEQAGEIRRKESWSYQPATIQWGRSPSVSDFLLVGYSPRSDSGEEMDIPEDKRNTGELCMFDSRYRTRLNIGAARSQNAFEVIWHPTQPIFLVATFPTGNFDLDKTKTQVRLFGQNTTGTFTNIKSLDCPAMDINELSIMPLSGLDSFVTASCTDGKTYVWDTARGDQPVHVLEHGDSLQILRHDVPREMDDEGVKFAAWGHSPGRFYTGSSDGVLKAWNVLAPPGKAHVRDVLVLSGGISAGAFSTNHSQLVIGDTTGKVHLLSVDDSDIDQHEGSNDSTTLTPLSSLHRHRPKLIIHHAEPAPPQPWEEMVEEPETSGLELGREYINNGQLTNVPHKGVFQGPNYAETNLYYPQMHVDGAITRELLPHILAQQRYLLDQEPEPLKLSRLPQIQSSSQRQHEDNLRLDLDFEKLSVSTQKSLFDDRAEYEGDYIFRYDFTPRKLFKRSKKHRNFADNDNLAG